ncbi:MAG: ABC transporter substrate-binding protein [Oscillospiraceae bacterium]|nr:ABC transporter substrate-binding protein [Oscillospiraceae bacterium]
MKRFNKVLCIGLAVFLAASLLTGCSGGGGKAATADATAGNAATTGEPSGNTYEITMWVYSDFSVGRLGDLFKKWSDEFVAANDNLTSITLIGKNDNELRTGVLSGVGLPNAFCGAARDGKTITDAIEVLDLTPFFNAAPASYRDGFMKDAIDFVTVDGKILAIPYISYVNLLYRNLDSLEKAGIDPADGVPTWDVFIEHCEKLKLAGMDATATFAGDWNPVFAIVACNEELTPGTENGKTTIKPEQLVPGLEVIQRLAPLTNTMKRSEDVAHEAFKAGQLGMVIEGPWTIEEWEDSGMRFDVLPMPALVEGGRFGGSHGVECVFGVENNDAELNDLVARWLFYITDYEQGKQYTSMIGRPMMRNDIMDDPEVTQHIVAKASALGLPGSVPQMPFFRSTVFWSSKFADASMMVYEGKSPTEAAEWMVDEINSMLADAGE